MSALKQSLRRIPYWAYILVLATLYVITVYLWFRGQIWYDGTSIKYDSGYFILGDVQSDSPGYNAGIRTGDTLVTVNSIPTKKWTSGSYWQNLRAGDTIVRGILRNKTEIRFPVVTISNLSTAPGFFWSVYFIMALTSIGSLFLLYKKPKEISVRLLFLYIQFFIATINAQLFNIGPPWVIIATFVFVLFGSFQGPALIHFHLLFPRHALILEKYPKLPLFIYSVAGLISMGCIVSLILSWLNRQSFNTLFWLTSSVSLWWLTLTFLFALGIVIYQMTTIKDSLSRNQLRIIIIGAFFSCITPIFIALIRTQLVELHLKIPYLLSVAQGTGGIIMIICFLIAIFRYRIWNIEVFIRKALLYLSATAVIILTWLFLIWIINHFTTTQNSFLRFLVLGVSVILFLALRDRVQRMIDRIFHRETYDSATVVSDFEAKLAGIYRFGELKEKIILGMDDIFHFKSCLFSLKKQGLIYESAFAYGFSDPGIPVEFSITAETEKKLGKPDVFSPEEIDRKPPVFELTKGDLVVPMVSEGQPVGFFICGQKKSEHIYSRQDINVLTLLARRVIALIHTANLYQKDLDRQLMLEQERARISRDMHDDIGAGLTKIAMISEAPIAAPDQQSEIENRKSKIASSARELISKLNVIVWALNPKYDNLESLISYLRRYFGEYLENFNIRFKTDFPEQILEIPVTPDTRRNIFYAIQEAIHNAVKHSGCSEICLEVKINPQNMEIIISDNGKGFGQVKPGSGGNGLINMKRRAEELGGSFEIQSETGIGTKVLLIFRW